MPQAFTGAPQGAIWGYDPTSRLWLPVQVGPLITDAVTGEEYAPMMVNVSNANPNGQALMQASSPVVIALDQPPVAENISQVNSAPPAAMNDGVANPTLFSFQAFPMIWNGGSWNRARSPSSFPGDSQSLGGTASGAMWRYNGNSWDRYYNNQDGISLIPSAAYTTTQIIADQTNFNGRGVIVVLDMTTVGTGSVTLEIDGRDPVSGKYYVILTGAAVTTNVTNVYRVYPGLAAVANATANDVLPRTWRVKVTANNANTATYSVGAILIA